MGWQEATRKILANTDVESEFKAMGVRIVGQPSSSGWLSCHAMGREDRNPSAAINVGDGEQRGRYKDHGGDGLSLNFFDFCAEFGNFTTWREARKHYAKAAGVKLPKGADKKPADRFDFRPWNEMLVRAYTKRRPPLTTTGVKLAGGILAAWPSGAAVKYPVLAFPIYGEQLGDGDPVGYVAVNRAEGMLQVFQGRGNPPKPAKSISPSEEGASRVWVGRHGVMHMADAELIWKVEGLTDMLALQSIIPPDLRDKHVVVTNASGCNEHPNTAHVASVAGKTVHVLHDADEPGQGVTDSEILMGARKWAAVLATTAKSCVNVQLPYKLEKDHGKDLRDWLAEGHSYDDLLELAGGFKPAEPNEEAAKQPSDLALYRQILRDLQIEMHGETKNGGILCYSAYRSEEREPKWVTLNNIGKVTYHDLLQHFGMPVKWKVNEGEKLTGFYPMKEVKEALSIIGSMKPAPENFTGLGCWAPTDKKGHEVPGQVLLVNAGGACKWDGSSLSKIDNACDGSRLIDISASDQWFDHDLLGHYLKEYDKDFALDAISDALELFKRWTWEMPEVDPHVLLGCFLATWIQTMWRWRPHVGISGNTNTGKSILIDTLEYMFGGMAIRGSKSSEAGIRQAVKENACPILCDEFENSKHRQNVFEMIRAASRGDYVVMGTSDQKGRRYKLQQMFWVAAIELGLQRAPDLNRFITFTLGMPPAEEHGKLVPPPDSELNALGQRLLAVAIHSACEAVNLAVELKSVRAQLGVDRRYVEGYAVPAAMIAVATGEQSESKDILKMFLQKVPVDAPIRDDEALLNAMLSAPVRIEGSREEAISALLSPTSPDNEVLERNGFALVYERTGPRPAHGGPTHLFVDHRLVKRTVLRGTEWSFQSIEQILSRIAGAEMVRRRIAGRRQYGVQVPMDYIIANHLENGAERDNGTIMGQ